MRWRRLASSACPARPARPGAARWLPLLAQLAQLAQLSQLAWAANAQPQQQQQQQPLQPLRVGAAINVFSRYGYLSISMRVVPRNDSDFWVFREPTVDVFKNITLLPSRPPRCALPSRDVSCWRRLSMTDGAGRGAYPLSLASG